MEPFMEVIEAFVEVMEAFMKVTSTKVFMEASMEDMEDIKVSTDLTSTAASTKASLEVGYFFFRSPCRLGRACCEACPSRLVASGGGLSGGCKAEITLKE